MAQSIRFFTTLFLLAMLVMATGPMRIVEARHCESLSHRFKGPCASDKNCASVCETERFSGGNCRGFRRRCFCTKPC